MSREGDPLDPKGLVRESYRIEGITGAECRSILLDWAVSTPGGPEEHAAAIRTLLERHAPGAPDHPMTQVLREGLGPRPPRGRRGGWRSRPR